MIFNLKEICDVETKATSSGVFERGFRKSSDVDEEQVKELHAKIGELAVANDFLERKLKPWTSR
ncbi:hypothetical protein [Parasedimentitalea psychrophila]|uniref:Transposase n=1 Tax=Parasedimentitalea psychrophila TaxID=2997337 RepID=A0A9Y2KZ53_9RHOB|nr:hypothetical protein [Parasedimentitalea psychrophila]WIY24427.1 hypothetical protein QPJ95_17905 [Parasedimentitalea psychrophila]